MSDHQAVTPRQRPAPRPHAVIVSDDPDLRDFLGQGLLFAGFWTSAIASGLQAIEVFRLRRFDLILIDAALGGLPAPEVIRRLRSPAGPDGTPLTSVPIAVIDAPAAPAERAALLDAGADAFLDPPLDMEALAADLMTLVLDWRTANPDEPWADAPLPQSRGPRGDETD